MGNVYRQQGQLKDAVASYKRCLSLNPHHADSHKGMGYVYYGQGQLKDANGSFKHCLKLKPDDADACNGMALVCKKQGQSKYTLDTILHKSGLIHDSGVYFYLNGIHHEQNGHMDRALDCYRNVVKLKPDFADAYERMGNIYPKQVELQKQGQYYNCKYTAHAVVLTFCVVAIRARSAECILQSVL